MPVCVAGGTPEPVFDREGTDPSDLDGLREALKLADPEGKLAPIGMSRVEIGLDALNLLPEVVSEVARGAPRVALVTAAPQRRDGGDLKARVERLLGRRFEVRRPVIGRGGPPCTRTRRPSTRPRRRSREPTAWWWSARAPTPSPTTWPCCSRPGPSAPSPRAGRTYS